MNNKPWAPKPERNFFPSTRFSVYQLSEANFMPKNEEKDFFAAMKENAEKSSNSNKTRTYNGAVAYNSTDSKLLNLNFAVSSLRNSSDSQIAKMFQEAFCEDSALALSWLLYARDVRQGLGERRLLKVCLKDLAYNGQAELVNQLIPLIPEYGRWDDILELLDVSACRYKVLSTIFSNWTNDLLELSKPEPNVSLMAKWLPSEQASNKQKKNYAKIIREYLNLSPKEYRKTLSMLRRHIDVLERKMSSNNWQAIDYEKVPSKANLIYRNAFLKHDSERRNLYLEALQSGEAKINSSVSFPYEIIFKYSSSSRWAGIPRFDPALEAMWEALPNKTNNSNTLVVADGSGSMITPVSTSTNATALDVANSLAIYCAQHNHGKLANKYITFSSHPQFVELNGETLAENIAIALRHCEASNTNIEAVFDLILSTAIRNNMSQEDLPENILILSDMEFDEGVAPHSYSDTLFESIGDCYKAHGYRLPKLVFWNLNAKRSNNIPLKQNELGITLVSGFSPNILDSVLAGSLDPYQSLVDILTSKRYSTIYELVKAYMHNTPHRK